MGICLRFTYIDDIVSSIEVLQDPKENKEFDFGNPNPSESWAPIKSLILAIQPVNLMRYIEEIENKFRQSKSFYNTTR